MDMKAMLARLNELNSKSSKGGGSKSKKVWKPKDEHDVRAVRKPDMEDPFVVRNFHGGIPNNGNTYPFSCPKNHGEDCSICEFASTLAKWKDDDGNDRPEAVRKHEWEVFKKIQAKPRYYLPVIIRGQESEGAQWWSFTENNYKELVKICTDVDWNSDRDDGGGIEILTSPTAAVDLHLSYREPGKKGNDTSLTKVVIEPRKKMSKLHADPKEAKKLIETIYPFDETHDGKRVTNAQAKGYLAAWLNAGITEDQAADAGKKDVEYAGEKPASQNAEKLTGTRSIDDAINDLVGA